MPSYGEKQNPAGREYATSKIPSIPGTRMMRSNNATITPTLGGLKNCGYTGNTVLNANK